MFQKPKPRRLETSDALTPQEWACSFSRISSDCFQRMAGGPLYTLAAGSAAVTSLSFVEGILSVRPRTGITMTERMRFILRYSVSQLAQSVVWSTQQPNVIAKAMGINPNYFYATPFDAPPQRTINLKRLSAFRGAVAGSVIISQVFSLMDIISLSMQAYAERIQGGKEPPLDDDTRRGVVVRMAGEHSLVTNLSLARGGRRRIFPIYENPNDADLQHMVLTHASGENSRPALLQNKRSAASNGLLRRYSTACSSDTATGSGVSEFSPFRYFLRGGNSDYRVPVYWKVDDGRYSHASSWEGMKIPRQWFFELPEEGEELLLLEADATLEYPMSLRRVSTEDFDLDLKEVAQGFSQLISLATRGCESAPFKTMRVLLVDPDAVFRSGGGRETTARDVAKELGLADVIVDARAPLIITIKEWLATVEARYGNVDKKKPQVVSSAWSWKLLGGDDGASSSSKAETTTTRSKPVILETPVEEWFESIKSEMGRLGYTVMDRADAMKIYGSLHDIPFIVYEKTTGDTFHTVSQLVQKGMVEPQQVCAFCPRPWAFEALMQNMLLPHVRYISSADLYDRLLHWVRDRAIEDGATAEEIQQELDNEMADILEETAKNYDGLVRIAK